MRHATLSTPAPLRLPATDRRLATVIASATLLSLGLHLLLFWRPAVEPAAGGRPVAAGQAFVRVLHQAPPQAAPAPAAPDLDQVLADPEAPIDVTPAAGPAAPAPARQIYFATDEVDLPAAPVTDWLVLRDESTAGRVYEFSARVFVSREGSIDRIEPVDAGLRPAGLDALLTEMQHTPMRPARLQGRDVASVRTIGFRIEVERDVL
ncbi:MAG: hypothetical protein EPO01_16045 [Aquabacterium sp.]|nr:MAG: hypothetical protein EPO01_16045 [Aquabacterium sp.]